VLLASKLQPHPKSPADRFKRDPLISPEGNYRILFSRPPDEFQVVPVNGNESVVIKGEAIGWRPRPHE